MTILVVDNYDSFTYNLVQGLQKAGARVEVFRNDAIDRDGVAARRPSGIVLSPGPGSPAIDADFGVCKDLILNPIDAPMLGICLGMQGMAHHTGGRVQRAPEVVHGEARSFHRADHPIFAGLPDTIVVGRYHSLCVDPAIPSAWRSLGSTDDGVLMGIAHRERPWTGLQFHPESILSPDGQTILENWLETT